MYMGTGAKKGWRRKEKKNLLFVDVEQERGVNIKRNKKVYKMNLSLFVLSHLKLVWGFFGHLLKEKDNKRRKNREKKRARKNNGATRNVTHLCTYFFL